MRDARRVASGVALPRARNWLLRGHRSEMRWPIVYDPVLK
jgi:hypothetical protein